MAILFDKCDFLNATHGVRAYATRIINWDGRSFSCKQMCAWCIVLSFFRAFSYAM